MSNGMRKGLGYKDRPEHVKTEATIAFELELDRTLEGGETMSVLSEQIKELREMADATHRRSREIGLNYGMGRGLADVSRILREAADTIESLRERLQRAEGIGFGGCELVRHEVELPDSLKDADVDISVYTCSVCGKRMFSDYNFCPNCGRCCVRHG